MDRSTMDTISEVFIIGVSNMDENNKLFHIIYVFV
jgi:hypothetical protein